MNYSAVLLRHGNYRLPTELFVLDAEGGRHAERVLYDRPGPPIGADLGDNGEIEARFDLGIHVEPGHDGNPNSGRHRDRPGATRAPSST